MGRFLAVSLRLSVIVCAAAMLFLCVRAAHAQGFQAAPGQTMPTPAAGTLSSPPLGMNGQPDPYAYYTPAPQSPNGYYSALRAPTDNAAPFQPAPAYPGPAYSGQPYAGQPYAGTPRPMPPQPMPQPMPTMAAPLMPQMGGAPMPAAYIPAPHGGYGYVLGPGDKIQVTVFDETDLSGNYTVDGSGMVQLPLIGTLKAAGYTAPGLEAWIRSALSSGYLKNPRVNVAITNYRPIYVVGAVSKPGEYPYAENMTLVNAVALAGGFNDQAVQSTVYVRHEGSSAEEEMPTTAPLLVRPGDVIHVKTTLFWDAMNLLSPVAGPAAIAAATIH